jgi:hypothetical protein
MVARQHAARILPMKTAGTQHFIERTYREGGPFQWVRETLFNSLEAEATRVEFGVEWQAAESRGVHRRVIADNGAGMTPDQLVEFFNTFGGGGKPIGGVHENFGVGAKTSLLPWNRHGVVVVSWVKGEPSMIRLMWDAETEEYGLKVEQAEHSETGEVTLESVYTPFVDEESGCDWAAIKPDWIEAHGTVIVLLGNEGAPDTVLGDPGRDEADIKGISSYLNRRLWDIPRGAQITVDEFRTQDKSLWPSSLGIAHGSQPKTGPDRRTNLRTVEGARHFIEYPVSAFKRGKLDSSGTVTMRDGTEIDWYLWKGERPAVQSYAAIGGYIGALYKNELYDVTAHHSTFRSFGVSEKAVRSLLWLTLRPQLLEEDGKYGVYPRTDRNTLLLKGGPNAGGPLPISDWAGQFADQMPQAIQDAIRAARGTESGTLEDEAWRERLAERFGARWRIAKLRVRNLAELSVDPDQPGSSPHRVQAVRSGRGSNGSSNGGGGRSGSSNTGTRPGSLPATKIMVAGGIPRFRFVKAGELADGMLAAWQPNDPIYPEGAVLINQEHPVLLSQIEHWQSQFADHHAEGVRGDVLRTYGEIAVAKIAHSEHLKGILPSKVVEEELRSDGALTLALLGLIAEEAVLATRLGGKYRRRAPTT